MRIVQLLSLFVVISLFVACEGGKKTVAKKTTTHKTPKTPEEPAAETTSSINYAPNDNLLSAQLRARNERKPVFMDFYTTWCGPCKMMDESLFMDTDVIELLNNSCIPLKINAEKGNGPSLQTQFAVSGYPTFVFCDANGDVLAQHRGTISIAEFKKLVKTATWKMSQQK